MNDSEDYCELRRLMIEHQIIRRGVQDPRVLCAMQKIPRHFFVPEISRDQAYHDGPLSIGQGQTISQPYMVASMTELVSDSHTHNVLEIGTGCGYQSALLAEIFDQVYSIERIKDLAMNAQNRLQQLAYNNIFLKYPMAIKAGSKKALSMPS